jgi:ankyrin repeat protein
MLQSIPEEQKDDAIKLLQLLTYSDEPLDLEEAVDAIAVNFTAEPFFDPKYRTPIPSDIIISCSSLVTIECVHRTSHNDYRQILQLAHFSVQQYLKSDKVYSGWKHCMSETYAKASNAKLCLAYCFELHRFDFGDNGLNHNDEYLKQRPFTYTAATQWTRYAVQVEEQDHQLFALIKDFLLSDKREEARLNWLRLIDSEDHWFPNREWSRASPEKLVPLTIASACGLYYSVRSLLLCGTDPNEPCPIWGSALYAASYEGHEDIVRLLLYHGARPNMRSGQGELSSAISYPNSAKRFEIVRALLQHDADVNVCDEFVGLPLVLAAACEDERIVGMLLERGAHVDAIDNKQDTALRRAAFHGYDKIVRKLLEHKADVNSSGRPMGTALISACYWGHEKVVRTLLNNGASVRQQFDYESDDWPYKTALDVVCHRGHGTILRLLFKHYAENSLHLGQDTLNRCFVSACSGGHDKIVKFLLEQKADVNVHDSKYGSPLLTASESGHEKVVRLLLDHGADIHQAWQSANSHAFTGARALYLACNKEHEGTIRLLLDHGADVNARGGDLDTVLMLACSRGYERIVELLLDHGADVNAQGGDLDTVLMLACSRGYERIVELLLARGANVNQAGEAYGTALILACLQCRETIVEMLLAHGADPNQAEVFEDSSVSRTPLIRTIAALSPFSDRPSENEAAWLQILKILIAAGADLNKADDRGRTPLHYAAVSRSSTLTKTLIEAGALLDEVDGRGQTPLLAATKIKAKGHMEVLLDAGAKTDVQDCDGRTALYHAANHGWLEIFIMLVEAGSEDWGSEE